MAETKGLSPRIIADCGLVAALSVVLVLIASYVPVLGVLASLVWAVPLISLVYRHGVAVSLSSLVVIVILSMIFTGFVNGSISALWIGFFGLVYGICFRKNTMPFSTLAAGTLAAGVILALSLVIGSVLGAFSLDALIGTMESTVNEVLDAYESAGLLGQLLPQDMTMNEYREYVVSMTRMIMPAGFIVSGMISAALNYLFATVILRRLNFSIAPLPHFRDWHFPWWILWAVIIAMVSYLMGQHFDGRYYNQIALNILFIYLPIFLISGISVVAWVLHRRKTSTFMKVVLVIAALIFARTILLFLAVIGAIDPIADYRKMFSGKLHKDSKNP